MMNIKEMIEVLHAAERGEKIEFRNMHSMGSDWRSCDYSPFNFAEFDYRIAPKPEPKLVPHYLVIRLVDGRYKLADYVLTKQHTLLADSKLLTEYPPIMLPEEP